MIRVGETVHQAILCPTCGVEVRLFSAITKAEAVFVCRNWRCGDKDILFTVNRMAGLITGVEKKEASDAKLGKTTKGR